MIKDKQIAYTGVEIPETTVKAALDWLAVNGGGGGGGGGAKKHFPVTLNDIVVGTTPTYIGAMYVDKSGLLSTDCKAFIGGLTVGDTATLELYPAGSPTMLASVSVTGTLQSVDFSSTAAISAGWYEIVLYAGGISQTAIARGLYLHV
jgi:hypothetical protein